MQMQRRWRCVKVLHNILQNAELSYRGYPEALPTGTMLYLIESRFTHRRYSIFQQRTNVVANMQHRGTTHRCYLLSLFHFRGHYTELIPKGVASKHQGSRKTKPIVLDKLIIE
jgi:hypothetical protein